MPGELNVEEEFKKSKNFNRSYPDQPSDSSHQKTSVLFIREK